MFQSETYILLTLWKMQTIIYSMDKQERQRWFTVGDLVARYGVSDNTIRIYIQDGYFPGARRQTLAKRAAWLIPQSGVDHYDRLLAQTAIPEHE
jgi:hypothetical protein